MNTLSTDTAILLVGGRGTRLGSLTKSTPKPLISVAGRPFLLHVLDYLKEQGIRSVVLSTGYLASQFGEAIGCEYSGLSVSYVEEAMPLGTGGAIQNAFSRLACDRAFVLNGDTLFLADLKAIESLHYRFHPSITVALRHVDDVLRYGAISLEAEKVVEMYEKGRAGPGLINGGTYLVERGLFNGLTEVQPHSFETITMRREIFAGRVNGLQMDAYFIDIGIVEDLARAERDLKDPKCK